MPSQPFNNGNGSTVNISGEFDIDGVFTPSVKADVTGVATDTTLQDVLTELQTDATSIPPTLPETLSGTNQVLAVKVNQTGAGTVTIKSADADELWDVLGWSLSFSDACTATWVVDDDDVTLQYPFDIPAAGIWSENIVDYARFSGNVNEPVQLINTAGNVKGVVYVRKHA